MKTMTVYQEFGLLDPNGNPIGTPSQDMGDARTGFDITQLSFANALDRCTPRSTLNSIGHGNSGAIKLVTWYAGFGAGTGNPGLQPCAVTYRGIHGMTSGLKHCQSGQPGANGDSVGLSLDKVLEPAGGVGSATVIAYVNLYSIDIQYQLGNAPAEELDAAEAALLQAAQAAGHANIQDWAATFPVGNLYQTFVNTINNPNVTVNIWFVEVNTQTVTY